MNPIKIWLPTQQNVAKPPSLLEIGFTKDSGLIHITKVTTLLLMIAGSSFSSPPAAISPSSDFLKYWKSGLAELSSYNLTTERYGELRKGQGVLVFVYEEINADSRVKVETLKLPNEKQIPVLKLNSILKFTTGIYDYSIMTSVFAGLSGPGVTRILEPKKISFSSQEWCGHVFHQVIPRKNGLSSEIHSYFEAEADSQKIIPYPVGPIYYEDEMPILVRELDREFMPIGETRQINFVPGLWQRRKRHVPLAFGLGTLTKIGKETILLRSEKIESIKWTLETKGMVTTYHIEVAKPHKLLAWENSVGEKGELIASIRNTYWEHNHNLDLPLRKTLGLNYGVGSGE